MHDLATRLFPICRSITGDGVRQSLAILQEYVDGLTLSEVPSGTKCFDWEIPHEWNIRDAYLVDPDGQRVVDFKDHNLHVVNYSEPIDTTLSLDELQPHLHSIPEIPDAIPYVTSYYNRRWGFCLTDRQRQYLKPGLYRAVIDATLAPGSLTYGDLVIPGRSSQEIFLSTYICHPSLGNNELSGPVVWTYLARWIASEPRHFTYRLVIAPETIGAICYISQNLKHLKSHVVAAFNLSCVGDERTYSFLPSRLGNTISDRVAIHVLKHTYPDFHRYTYFDRASDERQYCSPGVDLPMVSIMRSKYATYPEYHTSLDDLSLITPNGLEGAFDAQRHCLEILEANLNYVAIYPCEPQMGKRGLFRPIGSRSIADTVMLRLHVLSYCDGQHSVLDIAELMGRPAWDLVPVVKELIEHQLIAVAEN